MKTFDSVRDNMWYNDALGQAKAVADLLEAVGSSNEPMLDDTLQHAGQCLLNRLAVIDEQYEKLWKAYCEARKDESSGSSDGHLEAGEQIPAPAGEWWEDMKTNACQCLGDAYSLGYDAGRKADGEQ